MSSDYNGGYKVRSFEQVAAFMWARRAMLPEKEVRDSPMVWERVKKDGSEYMCQLSGSSQALFSIVSELEGSDLVYIIRPMTAAAKKLDEGAVPCEVGL